VALWYVKLMLSANTKDGDMIDYTQPWHVLDIDTSNALNPKFDAEKFRLESAYADKPLGIWCYRDNDMLQFLNSEWLEYMDRRGMTIGSFLMFYREPHFIYPEAHVDINWQNSLPHIFALNWVFSPDDDSFMTWYDVPNESGTDATTSADTKYRFWKLNDVKDKEFARHTIGNKLTMVRTGIAHNIIVNKQPRWLISLRFKNSPEITDWKSAVDYYNNTLKLIKHDTSK